MALAAAMGPEGLGGPLVGAELAAALVRSAEARLAKLAKARRGRSAAARFEALRALGDAYLELGELELADQRVRKGLRLAQTLYGEGSLEFRTVHNLLGVLYMRQGRHDRAADTFKELVNTLEVAHGAAAEKAAAAAVGAGDAAAGGPAGDEASQRRDPRARERRLLVLLLRAKRNYAGALAAIGQPRHARAILEELVSAELAAGLIPPNPQTARRSLGRATASIAGGSVLSERTGFSSATAAASAATGGRRAKPGGKRASLRKRLSLIIGGPSAAASARAAAGSASATGSGDSAEDSEFFFELPIGVTSNINVATEEMTPEIAAGMSIPMVELLDHITILLNDARRIDHIELLFRAALSGKYGSLSKQDELAVALRLAILLADHPDFMVEATNILQRAHHISEELAGQDSVQAAVIAGDLATLFARKGDLHTAERLFSRSLKVLRALERTHPKEEVISENLTSMLKAKNSRRSTESLSLLPLGIDDEWIYLQSRSDVTPEAVARTLRAGIDLEKAEMNTPSWYNWRDNERKKALLAYALEVFRDSSRNWEEEVSPRYLTMLLYVNYLLGLSTAQMPVGSLLQIGGGSESSLARDGSSVHQPLTRMSNRPGRASNRLARNSNRPGAAAAAGNSREAVRSPSPDDGNSPQATPIPSMAPRASSAMRFLDPSVKLTDVLSQFFAEVAPKKNTPVFISNAIDRYQSQVALLEALELRYDVTFNRDGTWINNRRNVSTRKSNVRPPPRTEETAPDASPERGRLVDDATPAPVNKDLDESGTLNADVSLRTTLENFYAEFAPERLEDVDKMLTHFKGRHKALFIALQNKYGVQFLPSGKAIRLHRV